MINISEIIESWAKDAEGWSISPGVGWLSAKRRIRVGTNVRIGADVEIGTCTRIYDDVEIGDGCSIGAFVTIYDLARIGKSVNVGDGVSIGAASWVGDFSEIGQGTIVSDHVRIGSNAEIGECGRINVFSKIGGNVSIGNHHRFGEWSMVGDWNKIGDYAKFIADVGAANGFRYTLSDVRGTAYVGTSVDWLTLSDAIEYMENNAEKDLRDSLCLMESAKALAKLHNLRLGRNDGNGSHVENNTNLKEEPYRSPPDALGDGFTPF